MKIEKLTLNALSFDVEEFFQAHNLSRAAPPASWEKFPSRIDSQMELILSILREADIRATFFFLGWVAERHREIVRKVMDEGHEVASHGYGHQFVYLQAREHFREDLRKSLNILQDITGKKVLGYRAPSFSITRNCSWALDIIREEGFQYDSSLFPVYLGDRGGMTKHFSPHKIREGLWELPVASITFLGLRLPLSGGFYFRLFPYSLTHWGVEKINLQGNPAVLYFHPWEFDPAQPHLKGIPLLSRFRHYVNLKSNENKLKSLISAFRWASLEEIVLKWTQGQRV